MLFTEMTVMSYPSSLAIRGGFRVTGDLLPLESFEVAASAINTAGVKWLLYFA
jgi:hypothetical protein